MRVLILGGGSVGNFMAKRLSEKKHDVTVVERREEACRECNQNDVRVVMGDARHASVLFQADVMMTDVCFALTGNDETNLFSGYLARNMGVKRVASRINSKEYRENSSFDYRFFFKVNRFLSQNYLTAMEIVRCIREPDAMLIEHFASGELELQEVVVSRESSLLNRPLSELKMPRDVRVAAITRDGASRIATANDMMTIGDRIVLIGKRDQVERIKQDLKIGRMRRPYVMIAGGGETGAVTASALSSRGYDVKVFERDIARCQQLANELDKSVTIIHGDCRRLALDEEGAGKADFFVGCTGDDEFNIMACALAHELGAKSCVCVIKHGDYATFVEKKKPEFGVAEVISPLEVMSREAEGFMHSGALVFQNSTILNGQAHIVEIEVCDGSLATREPLRALPTPSPTLVAAVVRSNAALMPHADFQFEKHDTVVALTVASNVPELARLFEKTA